MTWEREKQIASRRVDVVIPLRAWDFDRFKIALASYRHYWLLEHHIHLFCRPEEKKEAARLFSASDVTVHDKREACGPADAIQGGWFRAQVSKLAASRVVVGDFYLPSDPDIIITRKVTEETFFKDGKAPYYPRRLLSESVTPCEPDRFYAPQAIERSWKPLAKVLGLPMPKEVVPRMVTPLSKRLVQESLDNLSALHANRDWRQIWKELTGRMRPSDFALYYLVSHVRNNRLDDYHYPLPFLGKNVRTAEEAKTWSPAECFNMSGWFAMAIEAKSGITHSDLKRRLSSWIPGL